ncbi:MAG: hypothetical protein B6I34_07625 [Anaerolineaceae bacterium 4572_32.1]|nr:MAG: hypothetical protein B6I34_07625 [Anaerolineaceae bacterium 4572_32.1]
MSKRKLFLPLLIAALLIAPLTLSPTRASPPIQDEGSKGINIQSTPSGNIANEYLQVLTSEAARFIIGTTGGNPNTPDDDEQPLLFGYPSNVGSSFSTMRVISGSTTTDYQLGNTDWSDTGIAPIAPPACDGESITTIWEQDGIRVEEKLYFAQNPDTAAIEYTIKNNNLLSLEVGLRIMLDVMVGDNDGAPYLIPNRGQVTQQSEWEGAGVPEYWLAYELPSFAAGSLKSRGQLSGGNATLPDRFVIAAWSQAHESAWDYTIDPDSSVTNDSAVILYYNPATLGPDQSRTYRTCYGLGETISQTHKIYLPLVLNSQTLFPDLIVTGMAVDPASPSIGERASISVTVKNQGATATGDWFFVDLYVDPASPPDGRADTGAYFDSCSGSLEPGAGCTLTFTHTFSEGGTHILYAQADTYDGFNGAPDYGRIQESDEANNIYGPLSISIEPCREEIANGSFESDGGWEIPLTKYPAGFVTTTIHSGSRSMRIGIVEPGENRYSYSSVRQWVTIPADAISATLRYWLYPTSGEPATLEMPAGPLAATLQEAAMSGDTQYVLILDENEEWIDTLFWQRSDAGQWTFHQSDLLAYAGRTVKLHFGAYNDGQGGVTGMYVDDVSLELCLP